LLGVLLSVAIYDDDPGTAKPVETPNHDLAQRSPELRQWVGVEGQTLAADPTPTGPMPLTHQQATRGGRIATGLGDQVPHTS
jgi:hypothetical protein